MKRFKYLLTATIVCLLASCNGSTPSMQTYVMQKMKEYSGTSLKFNRLTNSDQPLDLSRCHPLEYYRTLTPPDMFGKMHECVAIKYQEGILYAVSDSRAMYFWDNEMLTTNTGIISVIPTDDNYWLPARVRGGEMADYECIAAGTNPRRHGVGMDKLIKKAEQLEILSQIDTSQLPLLITK